MADETSGEVPSVVQFADLRMAVERLEQRATWQTVANLLTLAVAAGALVLPFALQRMHLREIVVQELRVVDESGALRARLAWDERSDEAALVVLDRATRPRVELGTAGDMTVFELLPAEPTAGLRMQTGAEDVIVSLRHEPAAAPPSRLEIAVLRDSVRQSATAGLSTLSSAVASDHVELQLGRHADGFHTAGLELEALGSTLALHAEQAGRARLHVPAGEGTPDLLVEAKDGSTARLAPGLPTAVPPP